MPVEINLRTMSNGRLRRRLERIENPLPGLYRAGLAVASLARRKLSQRQIENRVSRGTLARSINVETSRHIVGESAVTVGTNLKYARIQNYGKPDQRSSRPNGLLAIPATMALRRAGVWPRDFGDELDFIPLKNKGNLKGILVKKETDQQAERRTSASERVTRQRGSVRNARRRASVRVRRIAEREERRAARRRRSGGPILDAGVEKAQRTLDKVRRARDRDRINRAESRLKKAQERRAKLSRRAVMFWCVEKVNIPARPYLDARDGETKRTIREAFEGYLAG